MLGLPIELTSTPLHNGDTYTSVAYDVGNYPSIIIAGKSDQNGKYYVDFSIDRENWDSTLTFDVTANTNENAPLNGFVQRESSIQNHKN